METRNYSESLNKSFEKLGVHIQEVRAHPESAEKTEREIVKQSLDRVVKETVSAVPPKDISPNSAPVTNASTTSVHVIPEYAEGESEVIKEEIEHLVESAIANGIEGAIKESLRHPAFIQDAFHDALIDKLMPEMEKRGMIK